MPNSLNKGGLFARKRAREVAHAPRTAKSLVLVLAVFLVGAIFWAARTEIRELARAEGEIVPKGRLTHVEHFDGGILQEVLATPGDRVSAGAMLARLISPDLGRTEQELRQELSLLSKHQELLNALIVDESGAPVPGTYAATRRDLHLGRIAMLRDRADGRAAALAIADSARDVAKVRLALAQAELGRLQQLYDKGYLPRTRISAQDDLLQTIRSDLLGAETALARALSDEVDANAAVAEARLAFQQELHEELFRVEQDVSRVGLQLSELDAQRDRLSVRTPVAGIVQTVATTTPGEVIEPGERLFEILPTTVELVADIRVTPEDIGHIFVGNPVKLKPSSFDARRYGQLAGQISRISPTSTLDPQGVPFFNVEVRLDSTVLDQGGLRGEVGAGMVVMAEMETSRRTVLQYLLKPIDQSLSMAMTER